MLDENKGGKAPTGSIDPEPELRLCERAVLSHRVGGLSMRDEPEGRPYLVQTLDRDELTMPTPDQPSSGKTLARHKKQKQANKTATSVALRVFNPLIRQRAAKTAVAHS